MYLAKKNQSKNPSSTTYSDRKQDCPQVGSEGRKQKATISLTERQHQAFEQKIHILLQRV